jgi:hypothetical protein
VRLDPAAHVRPRSLSGIDRLIALLAIAVFGASVLTVTSPRSAPTAAIVVTRSAGAATVVDRLVTRPRAVVRTERAVVHATPRRVIAKPGAHPAKPATKPASKRPTRFVPSGTGMWIYQWHHSDGGRAAGIVDRAKRVGLSTLYLRTGSSWDGFTADRTLPALLRATRDTDVQVVAWDFPRLKRPARDARRLAHAAWLGRAHSGSHVAAYLHVLRKHLPEGVTILSTVPWPSSYRRADYPYRTVAAHSDVLVPMAYWYNNSPGLVTARSIHYLRQFRKPVAPVGQGYDGKLDVPSLHHNNLAREVPVFLRTAARAGAPAVSIWSWQSAKPATWRALARAHRLFQ